MPNSPTELLHEVAGYYAGKLAQHGATPRGVDWNGPESQALRFDQLARVITRAGAFSLNDLGCGYGALLDHLRPRHPAFSYSGFDVSQEMVEAARMQHAGAVQARFLAAAVPDQPADYGIASGIFNVRLGRSDAEWQAYIEETLEVLDSTSTAGFAFNCLTAYSDAERMRADLYYADPCRLFDLCKRRYARDVALLHDYGLYEFTIVVRKGP
jgi:SAM-dependent methyltransferase